MPSQASAAQRQLYKQLYKQLLRLAQKHDRYPMLKALMQHPRVASQLSLAKMLQRPARSSSSSGAGSSGTTTLVMGGPGGMRIVGDRPSPFVAALLQAFTGGAKLPPARRREQEKEEEEQEDEDEDDDDDASSEHKGGEESGGADPRKKAFDQRQQEWSDSVSETQRRYVEKFFHGSDFYLPDTQSMSEVVRSEFRQPPPQPAAPAPAAAAAAKSSTALAAAAAAAASKGKHGTKPAVPSAAVDPFAQLTQESFSALRLLNNNVKDGAARKLMDNNDETVAVDPAFADAARAPQLRLDSPASGGGADDATLRMRPLPQDTPLRAGMFLIAHPQLDASPFERSVILLLETEGEGESGGVTGVVVNNPFLTQPNKLGEALKPKRMRLTDPLRHFKACALHDGGPVPLGPSDMVLLHRVPALAGLSKQLPIEGPPVWQLKTGMLSAAAQLVSQLIEQHVAALQAAAASSSASSASAIDGAASTSSSSLSSSALPPPFLPSDLVSFPYNSRWSPGQLEDELRRGSWILAQGNANHVFMHDGEAADEEALAAIQGAGAKKKRKSTKAIAAAAVTTAAEDALPADAVVGADPSADAPASSATESSATAAIAPSLSSVAPPLRLERPFPLSLLWTHALHSRGGREGKHWAYMPLAGETDSTSGGGEGSKQAVVKELLRGRE